MHALYLGFQTPNNHQAHLPVNDNDSLTAQNLEPLHRTLFNPVCCASAAHESRTQGVMRHLTHQRRSTDSNMRASRLTQGPHLMTPISGRSAVLPRATNEGAECDMCTRMSR